MAVPYFKWEDVDRLFTFSDPFAGDYLPYIVLRESMQKRLPDFGLAAAREVSMHSGFSNIFPTAVAAVCLAAFSREQPEAYVTAFPHSSFMKRADYL
jgi:hypothetical protein